MRNGQNNKRLRNRNNNNNNHNHNRRGQNPLTRVYESNGPDIKIRGTASHIAEKYLQLARDARSSSDPVAAENYYQHAEHYFRLIAAAQEQFRQNTMQPQRIDSDLSDEAEDEDGFSSFGAEPGMPQPLPQHFQPREPQHHPHRDQQPFPRDQQQPREHRPQPQPYPSDQQQPAVAMPEVGVDRLPSFITGGQPAASAAPAAPFEGGGERFPRRRRRPHGPRPDNAVAQPAPSEDVTSGS